MSYQCKLTLHQRNAEYLWIIVVNCKMSKAYPSPLLPGAGRRMSSFLMWQASGFTGMFVAYRARVLTVWMVGDSLMTGMKIIYLGALLISYLMHFNNMD